MSDIEHWEVDALHQTYGMKSFYLTVLSSQLLHSLTE